MMQLADFILHLDKHLAWLIENYGAFTYAVLFLIVFCETGLVVTPFLPGDSLLFAVGALTATGHLHAGGVLGLLIVAAVLGDSVNYAIGHWLAPRVIAGKHIPLINDSHIQRTREFYEKYGNKTIVLARFVPIVRTFAPFMAGVGAMPYRRFAIYNVAGGLAWVTLFVLAGRWFGNIPAVKSNFTLVIFAIIGLSLLPIAVEYARARRGRS